jgi:tRNA-dihydrouridine synthase
MAARVYDMGYPVVNLNMGCPFPKVANKGRGSGMLPEPDKVSDFLSETVPRMHARVSIKLRLGRSEPTEILALIPVLNRYPLAHLIIHPRVGRQMYTGRPDLETFEQCIEMIRHPVIYNGDVNAAADWEALSGRFPAVSGWMIGRGALCDPFLARAIKEGAAAYPVDAVAALEKFHDALYTAYRERLCGPGHLLDRMKGLWFYLSTGFADGRRFLKQIQKCRQVDAYGDLVDRFFDGSPQWSPRPPAAWH